VTAPAHLLRLAPSTFELGTSFFPGMRVPVRIFGSEKLVAEMDDLVFLQAAHVATLPGIVGASLCMPDAHRGYGFPIGGVAAMDTNAGVISPGGIGFDINCGMRLVRTDLTWAAVQPRVRELVDALAERVPAGVGSRGFVRLGRDEFDTVLREGAGWAVRTGYGTEADLEHTEARGCFDRADPGAVSEHSKARGLRQIGTLGSGNHYLEIQIVRRDNVYDAELARAFGLDRDEQVVVMFHCGSRGFGHQVASEYLKTFLRAMPIKYGIPVLDRELACAPFPSEEGQAYFAAMSCAANMSFANRQVILHRIREVFSATFGRDAESLGIQTVYDVAHNTAKLEHHEVDGVQRLLLVHRKGSTRAFPPGHPELPAEYQTTGQPVILGGSMETGSYLLAGVPSGAASFFSSAHGSGRTMSRIRARKLIGGRELQDRMEERGILVRTASLRGLAEEAGFAYKNVDEVAEASEQAGLSRRVARLVPVANVKG
jgi:tRNA-splicing ligase RtcB (3'-phosphate/5'-hydroxy nucleic acid ligase)